MSAGPLSRATSFAELLPNNSQNGQTAATAPLSTVENNNTINNNTNTLFSMALVPENDVSCSAPAFFVHTPENEKGNAIAPMEVTKPDTTSIGYGNRRLSRILSETTDKVPEKKLEKVLEIPKKRISLGPEDANRGIFGNGNISKKSRGSTSTQTIVPEVQQKTNTCTIRVFGYPANLIGNVIQHFTRYGKIEKYEQTPGNWITITYDRSECAAAALQSNGIVISKNYLIGVTLDETMPEAPIKYTKVVSADESDRILKSTVTLGKNGLGSGKAGISVRDKSAIDAGFAAYIKELIFGW
ncbi:uncharacterized protein B0P05DRAFT_538969 [Gilbertella persicaria]|uniref:uncharacterized protein n=1 Tax=Gilbertella persicaria TaxID=101096 RepID=UPI00221E6099|nr:uncharacterized protein B0P05DRAFT_538969 [Gilbertella persicaria]KAI8082003.1 hypothetical protein B0P05DRAFT_538969 [Gilbertella persicaria]